NFDSANTSTPADGVIADAGIRSPLRQRAIAPRLASPSIRNSTTRDRDNRAADSDTRSGGGFGASNTAIIGGIFLHAPVVIGKQARRVAVLAQAQQYQIEFTDRSQNLRVLRGAVDRPRFGGNHVHVGARDRYVIEQRFARHAAVALRVVGRRAALVTEVHPPLRPVGDRTAKHFVYTARRVAAGQHDAENPARSDRAVG